MLCSMNMQPDDNPRVTSEPPASVGTSVRHLWGREVAVGLISGAVVAAGSFFGQLWVDDQRSEREMKAAELLADEADRRENLRFVRERSGDDSATRPFGSVDLVGKDLSFLKLANSHFDSARLDQTDFSGTNMTHSRLVTSSLVQANFRNADLKDAILYSVDATGATFSSADLTEAQFGLSNLSRADLTDAKLIRANLGGVNFTDATFTRADLTESKLQLADFRDADLTDANLSGAHLFGTKLTGANFNHTNLSRAVLAGTDLRGLDLTKAVLNSIIWETVADTGGPNEATVLACHDASTLWPEGFVPPESDAATCLHPGVAWE